MADHHDESLIDKVKNALGMGDDHGEEQGEDHGDERAEGWAGVPEALHEDVSTERRTETDLDATGESGYGRNPGPVGSAQYEGGATPADLGGTDRGTDGELDTTREDSASTEFGGAYGQDDTPMPTSAAWDRGEAPPEEVEPRSEDDPVDQDRRETGI